MAVMFDGPSRNVHASGLCPDDTAEEEVLVTAQQGDGLSFCEKQCSEQHLEHRHVEYELGTHDACGGSGGRSASDGGS